MSIHQGWTEGPVSTELGIFASGDAGNPPAITRVVTAQLITEAELAKAKDLFEKHIQEGLEALKATPMAPGDKFVLTITLNFASSDDSDEPLVVSES